MYLLNPFSNVGGQCSGKQLVFLSWVNAWSPEVGTVCSFLYPYASPSREHKGTGERQGAVRGQDFPQIAGGVTSPGPILQAAEHPPLPLTAMWMWGSPFSVLKNHVPTTRHAEALSPFWVCVPATQHFPRRPTGFWGILQGARFLHQPFGKFVPTQGEVLQDAGCSQLAPAWHRSAALLSEGLWMWICDLPASICVHRSLKR